jgi:carotenoid cleavage dioxygenase-like enzyme
MYDKMKHYFDGLAMLVHFRFEGGGVAWQQRFLDTMDYRAWRETGAPRFSQGALLLLMTCP